MVSGSSVGMTFPGEVGGFLWRMGGLAAGRSPQSLLVSCVVWEGSLQRRGHHGRRAGTRGSPSVSVLPRQAGPGITG